jgi:hypothetical protein
MESIQFRSDDAEFMQSFPDQLVADLQKAGLGADFQVSLPVAETDKEPTRRDPVTMWTWP